MKNSCSLQVLEISALLANVSIRAQSEAELQDALSTILDRKKIAYEREVRFGARDRIDFLVGRLGIELKIDGPLSALTRQLHRYAQIESIDHLLVVTTRYRLCALPAELAGKPVSVVMVGAL